MRKNKAGKRHYDVYAAAGTWYDSSNIAPYQRVAQSKIFKWAALTPSPS